MQIVENAVYCKYHMVLFFYAMREMGAFMKRFVFCVSGILLALCFVMLLPNRAEAASYSGTCGENVSWSLNTVTGVLTITGSGPMENYKSMNYAPWYQYQSDIRWVTIGEGVTTIGDYAFDSCGSLSSVEIPGSVTTIGDYAFCGCFPLANVGFPAGVTTIGDRAFFGCHLHEVGLPKGLITIGDWAFAGTGLTDVWISESVTTIGNGAFAETSVTSVMIPAGVTAIGERVFDSCNQLTAIHVDANNPVYSSDDTGVLFNKKKTLLIQAPEAISGVYSIPQGVTTIGDSAFVYCDSLTSVEIPGSVTTIGDSAFGSCDSLTSVEIPGSVTTIGDYAFWSCGSLTSVEIPGSVTTIGDHAFWSCDSLTSVEIPGSVTTIGDSAFGSCDSLTSVEIPGSVTTIGDSAFAYTKLTSVEIPGSVTTIGEYAFRDTGLTTVVFPEGVVAIGARAFANCYALTEIEFLGSCPSIGSNAFASAMATASYPLGDSTWTADRRQNYGGTITWVAVCRNHQKTLAPAVAPTCTATGLTEGTYCSICNEILVAQEVISALGHRVRRMIVELKDPLIVTNAASYPYTVTDGTYYSANKRNNSAADLLITAQYSCTLTLEYGVSSEAGFDRLLILHNGRQQDVISGEVEGKRLDIALNAGDQVTVRYTKDSSGSSGQDRGWVTLVYSQVPVERLADVPADTQEAGCHGLTCDYCQLLLKEPLGHDLGEWEVAEDATCIADGSRKRTCSRCDYTEEESIPATGAQTGDFTGDGQATYQDAIYLLRHILDPERYPLSGDVDYNGDGTLTDADAIYLLRYSLMPQRYPLGKARSKEE